MLNMDQYELIKTAHRFYGKSIREIAKEFGHSRKTVRKALQEVHPQYKRKKERECPVMSPYRAVILEWLKSDEGAPKKQRHTAGRIYTRLVEAYDFQGAESTVRRFVRRLKIAEGLSGKEAFVPLEADAGKEAEVDWGEAVAIIDGQRRKIEFLCMRSKYSGKDFVRAYPNARQEMFFDGHIHGFHYYGGVFPTMVYDNLSSAVLQVLKGKRRIEQQAFRNFRSYYTFEARFCNPGKGHEKGGVEGLVGYARRNYLTPVPEVESFEALNALLLERCRSQGSRKIAGKEESIDRLFKRERPLLLALPATDYPVMHLIERVVEPYSTLPVDHNRYSVPTDYVGLKVRVELGVGEVRIYYNRRRIAVHRRVFGKNNWQLDPFHYLKLLSRKPGAFDAARPIRDWRSAWPAAYERLLQHFRDKNGMGRGTRAFVRVLMLLAEYPQALVNRAIETAVELSLSDDASVKLLVDHWQSNPQPREVLSMDDHPQLVGYQVTPTDLARYDQLRSGKEVACEQS